MKKIVLLAVFFLTGCTPTMTDWRPVDGSMSDGKVELERRIKASTGFGAPADSFIDEADTSNDVADREAARLCKQWQFITATTFGGNQFTCISSDARGNCMHGKVSRKYQCVNK